MTVFLITPYKVDKYFENKKSIAKEAFNKYDIDLALAEDNEISLSVDKTIELFQKSDFFIADLSLERPSCYYELGYLQALKKSIFIISKRNEKIHQMLGRDSILFYDDLNGYKEIMEKISLQLGKREN